MTLKDEVRGLISEHTGFDSVKDSLTEAIMEKVRERVRKAKWGYLHGERNCQCDSCKIVNTRNQALDDLLTELGGTK